MKKYVSTLFAISFLGSAFLTSASLASQNNLDSNQLASRSINTHSDGNSSISSQFHLLSQTQQRSYQRNRVRSIRQAADVNPSDWNFQALESFTENYGLIRLFSDGTFGANQPATVFEILDWTGGALDRFYDEAEFLESEAGCEIVTRPSRSVDIPSAVDRDAFYYPAFVTISSVTGVPVPFRNNRNDPLLDGNQVLTRLRAVEILDRFFAQPTLRSLGLNITSSPGSSDLATHLSDPISNQAIASHLKSLNDHDGSYLTDDYSTHKSLLFAQLTSVDQLRDVDPSPSLRRMVEMYGVLSPYPDGTFRPNNPVSRGEFVAIFNALLDQSFVLLIEQAEQCNQPRPSSGGSGAAPVTPQGRGTILSQSGTLAPGNATLNDGSLYQQYWFQGRAGQTVRIQLSSDMFDTYLILLDDQDNLLGQNDDRTPNDTNSELVVTLPRNGSYRVIVNAFDHTGQGRFLLTVD